MILVKTEAGQQVFKDRSVPLSPRQRTAFILFDGKRSVDEVLAAGNGIAREEIDQMVSDAQAHADEDKKRKEEIETRNRADQAGIDIARRTTMQSVTNAWVQLSSARVAVSTGQRQVDSAQQAFAGMSCEELNGLRDTIETLNAEEELQAAQLQLVQSRYTPPSRPRTSSARRSRPSQWWRRNWRTRSDRRRRTPVT